MTEKTESYKEHIDEWCEVPHVISKYSAILNQGTCLWRSGSRVDQFDVVYGGYTDMF